MSKDTSKLEEIRKALGLDGYGAKCTGLDCSHEIGVDHYIITDVHLADLLSWHREEVIKARIDEVARVKVYPTGLKTKSENEYGFDKYDVPIEERIEDLKQSLRASLEVE